MEKTWKRKEYETWEEAFMGLAPAVRQQSVRVADYARVLFVQASAMNFGVTLPGGAERMNGKYADLAYKCGLYHQLGKALVPVEYQIWQKDFTEEEKAVYNKYTTDGRLLVANLQERSLRAWEKRTGKDGEYHTDNIPWMMIREACSQHMERYDGSGYPLGLLGDKISPIAQIVGLAKELDRLSAETKSENPFAEAYDALMAEGGKAFAPELIEVLSEARGKCRNVYNKYIYYTMTLPKTIPLVDKRPDRPMGLTFRPMTDGEEGNYTGAEASMWFGGIAGRPADKEGAAEVEQMLDRVEMTADMTMYFLYEAADALLRIENCKLGMDFVVLNMLPSFYRTGSQLQKINQMFKYQPIDRSRLLLTIPQSLLLGANKSTADVVKRYLSNGVQLILDEWDPAEFPLESVKEYGFRYVRPSSKLYMNEQFAALLLSLPASGVTVIAGGADDHDIMRWLAACGVTHMSGTLTGNTVNEDELIRECLVRERSNG